MATEQIVQPPLHHINLKTIRMDEMIDFYGKVIGVKVIFKNDFAAFTSNDDAHHRVVFITLNGMHNDPEKVPHTGLHHTAFDYASLADLIATFDRLRGEGILPHMSVDHGMSMALYYSDPDGNSVELQVDNFPTQREAQEYMRTSPEFRADPFGTYFDPMLVSKELSDGLSHQEIHAKAWKGAYENEVTAGYDPHMPMSGGVPL
jgi:catechol 2,3-dioxygenase